ncbi:MAG: HAMP domain-containing histidine kinase [Calditrichaeota bacterium]|nr:HAMP domain-containing histidine kinase [Calditrichota bacterium]
MLTNYIKGFILPYNYEIVRSEPELYQSVFHDFDKDGTSEQVNFNYNEVMKKYVLTVLSDQRKLIAYDKFDGYSSILNSWISFNEFNGDGYDDLFIFTRTNESLFLSLFDVKNERKIGDKILIEKNMHLNDSTWLPQVIDAKYIATDNSGNKQLVFTIFTGYALYPRGIYKYDFNTKILSSNKQPAAFTTLSHADFDKDGNQEIITSAFACDNYKNPTLTYSDNYSWLFFLDKDLNWYRQPERFYEYPSHSRNYIIHVDGEPLILSESMYIGEESSDKPTKMMLLNGQGQIVKQKVFGFIQDLNIINYDQNLDPVITIVEDKKRILQLDKKFNILREKEFKNDLIIMGAADLFKDGKDEYICRLNDAVLVLSNQFNILTQIPVLDASANISIRNLWDTYDQLLLKSNSGTAMLVQFERNTYYSMVSSLYVLLPILIYFFLIVNYNFFSFLLIYSGFMIMHLNKSQNGILVFSSNKNIIRSNKNFYSLLGLKKQSKNKDLFKTISEQSEMGKRIKVITADIGSDDPQSFTDLYPNIKINIEKIKSIFNKPIAYVIEAEDISEPIHSDRAKVWSKTVQKMAHDIKTPLSSVTVGLKTLQYQLEAENLQNRDTIFNEMHIMRSEIERVREMTRNFLKFTNLEKPNYVLADLHDSIRRSLDRFRDYLNNDIELKSVFDTRIKPFLIDSVQLELVFNILIENAIDAMKGKGLLNVQTSIIENVFHELSDLVEIQFTDNGSGIPKEIQNRIFEPYFTEKEDGTGMGLAIAKKIIEDHKGKIGVYSSGQLGATFTVTLPYNPEGENDA